jgi:SAM-dependent methyltransferase
MVENYGGVYIYKHVDYEQPKEHFKFAATIIEKAVTGKKDVSILDVGCAKGELLYYLKSRFDDKSLYLCGVDFSETLIEVATNFKGLQGVDFYNDDAETFKIEKKFDVIMSSGLLGFFDDSTAFLDNILSHLKPGGMICLTSSFSTSNYDVIVKYRHYGDKTLESGWNQHCIEGIKLFMSERGKMVKAHKFNLPFELHKTEDVLRSWTINTSEGQNFTCGLNLIWNVWCLEIQ